MAVSNQSIFVWNGQVPPIILSHHCARNGRCGASNCCRAGLMPHPDVQIICCPTSSSILPLSPSPQLPPLKFYSRPRLLNMSATPTHSLHGPVLLLRASGNLHNRTVRIVPKNCSSIVANRGKYIFLSSSTLERGCSRIGYGSCSKVLPNRCSRVNSSSCILESSSLSILDSSCSRIVQQSCSRGIGQGFSKTKHCSRIGSSLRILENSGSSLIPNCFRGNIRSSSIFGNSGPIRVYSSNSQSCRLEAVDFHMSATFAVPLCGPTSCLKIQESSSKSSRVSPSNSSTVVPVSRFRNRRARSSSQLTSSFGNKCGSCKVELRTLTGYGAQARTGSFSGKCFSVSGRGLAPIEPLPKSTKFSGEGGSQGRQQSGVLRAGKGDNVESLVSGGDGDHSGGMGGIGGDGDGDSADNDPSPFVPAAGLSAFWVRYSELLDRHPLVTKSLTAGLLNAIADLFCQVLIEKVDTVDLRRLVSFLAIGLFMSGPGLHFWYGILSRVITVPGIGGVVLRTAADQFVFTPLGVVSFFVVLLTLEGRQSDIADKLQKDVLDIVVANWKVWIPFQIVNFGFVPPQLQVAAAGLLGMVWSVFISFKGHS